MVVAKVSPAWIGFGMVIGLSAHDKHHSSVKRIGPVNVVLHPGSGVPAVISIEVNPMTIPPPSSISMESFISSALLS